jgi:DNA repair protein RAD5
MVSEEHINVLGNKPLSLEEIHEKMTLHYKNKIEKYTKRLSIITEDLNKLSNNPESDVNIIEEKKNKFEETKQKLTVVQAKYNIFSGIEEKIEEEETCPICMEELKTLTKTITPCGHIFCSTCINDVNNHTHGSKMKCAMCRHSYNLSETVVIKGNIESTGPTLGTKIEHLINTIKTIITEDNTKKIIVFSQWDNMLRLVSKIFNEHEIKNIFLNGSINTISSKIRKFKIQNDINVVLMSSDKSPSGLHLTEASTIILLDTLNTTKEEAQIIEEQAIGRAVRIGQTKQVEVKRFIMRNTIEHDYYIRNIEE